MSNILEIDRICLAYNTKNRLINVIDSLSMNLSAGSIVSILGQSGCGKTTLLRAIAGFEPVRSGKILINGQIVSSSTIQVPPEKRCIGMTFQDYALFPHLTVEKNIEFGLKKLNHSDRKIRINEMLDLVNLQKSRKSYPNEISGGQQQRLALARALAPAPGLLLLDEPFSNLDIGLRETLAFEVRQILKSTGHAAILVTHNQSEAFAVADQIGIIHEGKIAQWGTLENILHYPANSFIERFVRYETSPGKTIKKFPESL